MCSQAGVYSHKHVNAHIHTRLRCEIEGKGFGCWISLFNLNILPGFLCSFLTALPPWRSLATLHRCAKLPAIIFSFCLAPPPLFFFFHSKLSSSFSVLIMQDSHIRISFVLLKYSSGVHGASGCWFLSKKNAARGVFQE